MANDRPNSPLRRDNRQEPMQRIRVGVTGLAAVILIVLLAAAIATSVRRTVNLDVPGATASLPAEEKSANSKSVDPNAEPLAQLGVAPAAIEHKDLTVPADKHPE
jgi:cobalamin synthase